MAKEIKYTDKSKGQPELVLLFSKIKELMQPFVRGNYVLSADKPGHYEIYYRKEVEILGKRYPELLFASMLVQKGYVGFYFFPIYIDEALKQKLGPELFWCLKGKTCFHLKKDDPLLLNQVHEALRVGLDYYNSRGWN